MNEDEQREAQQPEIPAAASVQITENSVPAQPATEQQLRDTEQKIEVQIEERMTGFERSMVRLTRYGLAVTILTGIIFAGQLYEMWTGGTATDKLVKYAETQANASSDISDAAQQFSDTANDIDDRMSDAIDQLGAAADNAGKSIKATQTAMRLEQRAWVAQIGIEMDAPEVGKIMHGSVTWSNSGKTFAKKVQPLCHLVFVPDTITGEKELISHLSNATLRAGSIGVLAPNGTYKTPLETGIAVNDVDKSRIGGDWYTYIWGEMTYFDIFKNQHSTIFCSWRKGSTGDFVQCPFHNDAD